jgi:hypothetical protein
MSKEKGKGKETSKQCLNQVIGTNFTAVTFKGGERFLLIDR